MKHSLLFGNGLNQVTNNGPKWNELLKRLKGYNNFDNGELPNTMIYERIFMERGKPSLEHEIHIKNEISEMMSTINSSEFYKLILDLKLDNYITTNYDYAMQKTFHGVLKNMSTENIYSIRRHWLLENKNMKSKIWHIHGEIDNPKTIQLGLDQYCGSIGKIDAYIKGTYFYPKDGARTKTLQIEDKCSSNDKNKFDNISWVELFFNTNIHILGFGLDYSETDIWWIINKRARLMMKPNVIIENEITYYTHKIEEEKKGLLESLKINVEIIEDFTKNKETNYEQLYKFILKKIKLIKESDE